jgi:hypothetical protein
MPAPADEAARTLYLGGTRCRQHWQDSSSGVGMEEARSVDIFTRFLTNQAGTKQRAKASRCGSLMPYASDPIGPRRFKLSNDAGYKTMDFSVKMERYEPFCAKTAHAGKSE